jgi:hypothetical protein
MYNKNLADRITLACDDPIKLLAEQVYKEGISSQELIARVKEDRCFDCIAQPTIIRLVNHIRDLER